MAGVAVLPFFSDDGKGAFAKIMIGVRNDAGRGGKTNI